MTEFIYHITTPAEWQANPTGDYTPAAFAQDGFIHCSQAEELAAVANRYFRGQRGLLLLKINPLRALAPIRYEDLTGSGVAYPHVYGALNRTAVEAVLPFEPGADGLFISPA